MAVICFPSSNALGGVDFDCGGPASVLFPAQEPLATMRPPDCWINVVRVPESSLGDPARQNDTETSLEGHFTHAGAVRKT